ncbi:MAG TPA: RNA 2',3'-cyclic phosphodiesterase [candidate division Zixibacteria bacterium]|nr:RNA 2',3'-cyclic phosphodiesterase [candidate division Zixibacteria bacterium]
MSHIRAFIAIEVPDDVGKALSDTRRILNSRLELGGIRWVKTSNIHLTLRFLGNVNSEQLPALYEGLDIVAAQNNPFSLDLDVLGCFPNARRPRVIWVGLTGETGKLNLVNGSIERVLDTLGWESEGRDFHPHLTLGRVKDPNRVVNSQLPWGEVMAEGRIDVQAIHLVESQLLPTGAVYTIRHSGSLQK